MDNIELKIKHLKARGKSPFEIAYRLGLDVETVIKILYNNTKLASTTRFNNYAPVRLKCLCCGKSFISTNKRTNRICNKCKSQEESGCFSQYIGLL